VLARQAERLTRETAPGLAVCAREEVTHAGEDVLTVTAADIFAGPR
jgi:hypothetical protein